MDRPSVLHLGNLGNAAYTVVRLLRDDGHDARLLFRGDDFVFGDPRWEDGDFEVRGLRTVWDSPTAEEVVAMLPSGRWVDLPPYVQVVTARTNRPVGAWFRTLANDRTSLAQKVLVSLFLAKGNAVPFRYADSGRDVDIIHSWAVDTAYAPFAGKPFLASTNGGDILELPFRRSVHGRLQRAAYRAADLVLLSEPRYFPAARRLGLSRITHFPLAIDMRQYRPSEDSVSRAIRETTAADLVLVWPTRQDWAVKGSDVFLRAFARFAKGQDVRLIMMEWGRDLERSLTLAQKLGVRDRIRLVPACAKQRLLRYYWAADAVVDQFVLGWHGSTMIEAMACGKPVFHYIDTAIAQQGITGMPPVLNGSTIEELVRRLEEWTDPELRKRLASKSIEWVEENHGWRQLGPRLLGYYEKVAAGEPPL